MEVQYDFFGEILPPECALLIFSYLAPIDVVNISQVSKTFFNLIDSRGIWKKAVEYQFGKLDEDYVHEVQQNLLKINWRVMFNYANTITKWLRYFHSPKFMQTEIPTVTSVTSKSGQVCQATDGVYIIYANEKKKSVVGKLFGFNPFFDKVVGLSDNIVVVHNNSEKYVAVCNLKIQCKHANEQKWKSSPNHLLPCKELCSRVHKITGVQDVHYHKLSETGLVLTNKELISVHKLTGGIEKTDIDFSKIRNAFHNYRYDFVHHSVIVEARNLTRDGKTNLIAIVLYESGYVVVNVTERTILRILKGDKITWFSKSSYIAIIHDNVVYVTDFMNGESAPLQKVADAKMFSGATIYDITASKEGEYTLIVMLSYGRYFSFVNLLWPIGLVLGEHNIEAMPLTLYNMSFSASDPSVMKLTNHQALKFSQPLKFT